MARRPGALTNKFPRLAGKLGRRRGRTLASKTGVSQGTLSSKIAKVKREKPSLTNRQASGKAAGILKGRKK